MGFIDSATANESTYSELNPPCTLTMVADKTKMTVFGFDSITEEREVYVMTGCRLSCGMIYRKLLMNL